MAHEIKPTRFWVLKRAKTGEYYTQAGPPLWVQRQRDAWRFSMKAAKQGEREASPRGCVRAVRVFKRMVVSEITPCTTSAKP